ncbi:MAG: Bug family tripartite tricarboxylate transporter substrate binding protein [Burkholderiaceae bacterium]
MKRRQLIQSSALFAWLALSGELYAQTATYPSKPIKMIVPLAAGSAVDNAARIVMQKVASNMGTSIAIENQAGAAGLIGADRVAKSAPDGYALGGFNDSIMTMLPNLQTSMPWNILKDFDPVSLVATVEWGVVVPVDSPWKTIADFMNAAKQNPGKINYGSGGNGSPQHIAVALFASQANIKVTHVPYKGATQAAVGVAGKEVDIAFQGIATVFSLVKAGKLKMLAVCSPKRLAQFPDIPTISESGLPNFEFNSWFAVLAPAGTSKPIAARIQSEIVKAIADPAIKEQLIAQGLTPRASTPDELSIALKAQLSKYEALIRQAGITAD